MRQLRARSRLRTLVATLGLVVLLVPPQRGPPLAPLEAGAAPPPPQPTAAPKATPTSWVQVVDDSATVFASDSGPAVAGPPLARYTFLNVLNATPSRLQVDVYDEYGHVTTSGWVNAH